MVFEFSRTVAACLRATKLILSSPKNLGLCLIPWVLGALVWIGVFWGLLEYKDSILFSIFSPEATMGYGLDALFYPVALILAGVIAIPFVLIINELSVEWLILGLLKDAALNGKRPCGRSILGAFGDLFVRLVVIIPLSIAVFLLGLIPVVGIVALIPSSFLIGLTLYDYPLCLFDLTFRERFTLALKDWKVVTSLGALFSLSFFIPGGSILILPLGYAAAVLLIIPSQQ